MVRLLGFRLGLGLAVLAAGVAAPTPVFTLTTSVPAGSGIVAVGIHPPKNGSGLPLVEHMPLRNLVNFEIHFRTTSMPVTFVEGLVEYFDVNGNLLLPSAAISVQTFLDQTGLAAAAIPADKRVILFFPLEELPFNVLPATIDVHLCFQEFAGPGGECVDPLSFEDIAVSEYLARPEPTYIYPFGNPVGHPNGRWFTAHGHELAQGHRRGGLRRSGDQVWVNQRYAYDFGVLENGVDRNCADPNNCTNAEWFAWDEPLVATGDGIVVGLLKGMVDNAKPGATHPNLCDENDQPPGCLKFCACGQIDIGVDPPTANCLYGSGNTVVLDHGNGEYSWYAHMKQGTNNHLSLGDSVSRGDVVGHVGNAGASGGPHLHFALMNGPDPECDDNVPFYASNVEFLSPGHITSRRQLDVSLSTPTTTTNFLAAPFSLPSNAALPVGPVMEVEPNDTLPDHVALSIPTTVTASLEDAEVGDLAVRGDGIEDVYRVNLSAPDALRFDLDGSPSSQNLDLYVLTEELGVLNPTRQGTSPGAVERVCLELGAGSYYALASNVDLTRSGDTPYALSVTSDPQTISVEIEQGAATAEVDASCDATVSFRIAIHDNCCLDKDNLNLQVTPTILGGNASVGAVTLNPPQVLSSTDVIVTGEVVVSNLTSCPAVLRIDAAARDCEGNVVDTAVSGGEDMINVIDTLPPVVTSSAGVASLWPPNHELVDVGFLATVVDNCDAQVGTSLATAAWSNEEETLNPHAPDAADFAGALRLRAERRDSGSGRVYLLVSTAADACGNSAFACTVVGVPHSLSDASATLLAGDMTQAKLQCEAQAGAPPAGFFLQGQSPPTPPKQ
jgi:hypothetical protein